MSFPIGTMDNNEFNDTCPQVLTDSELKHSDDVTGWINLIKQIVAGTGIMANQAAA